MSRYSVIITTLLAILLSVVPFATADVSCGAVNITTCPKVGEFVYFQGTFTYPADKSNQEAATNGITATQSNIYIRGPVDYWALYIDISTEIDPNDTPCLADGSGFCVGGLCSFTENNSCLYTGISANGNANAKAVTSAAVKLLDAAGCSSPLEVSWVLEPILGGEAGCVTPLELQRESSAIGFPASLAWALVVAVATMLF